MKKYLLSLFLTSQVFAIGGIGVYGMSDMVSRTPSATSDDLGLTTMTPGEITNHVGVGGFCNKNNMHSCCVECRLHCVAA